MRNQKNATFIYFLFLCTNVCDAFQIAPRLKTNRNILKRETTILNNKRQYSTFHLKQAVDDDIESTEANNESRRRDFILSSSKNTAKLFGVATTISSILSSPDSSYAAEVETATKSLEDVSNKPVVVIGANGKTGTECVKALASLSVPVIATSRSGVFTAGEESLSFPSTNSPTKTYFSTSICDVTKSDTISSSIKGARAVIFAASASKQGGTPNQVDNEGLVSVAKACIAENVDRLVIVSSGAVTKPSSPVFLFLNLFGKIMEEKIKGEDAVRALYANLPASSSSPSYTIIRPGGLTEEESLGASALELNQGDTKSGRIARADVAKLCVQSVLNPKLTENTTFECYNKDTGAPLASVGVSNIMKAKTNTEDFVSGRECLGSTWEEIFSGLERD